MVTFLIEEDVLGRLSQVILSASGKINEKLDSLAPELPKGTIFTPQLDEIQNTS